MKRDPIVLSSPFCTICTPLSVWKRHCRVKCLSLSAVRYDYMTIPNCVFVKEKALFGSLYHDQHHDNNNDDKDGKEKCGMLILMIWQCNRSKPL